VLERLVEEVEGAEHVAVVGDRDGGHAELGDAAAELRETIRAIEEGVLTVEMEVNEVAGHRTPIITLRDRAAGAVEKSAARSRLAFS